MNNMTDMAEQLDVKLLLSTLMALKKGDFSVRMREDLTGADGQIDATHRRAVEALVESAHSQCVRRSVHGMSASVLDGVAGSMPQCLAACWDLAPPPLPARFRVVVMNAHADDVGAACDGACVRRGWRRR